MCLRGVERRHEVKKNGVAMMINEIGINFRIGKRWGGVNKHGSPRWVESRGLFFAMSMTMLGWGCVFMNHTRPCKPSQVGCQSRPPGQQTIPPDERRQDNRPETTADYRLLNSVASRFVAGFKKKIR